MHFRYVTDVYSKSYLQQYNFLNIRGNFLESLGVHEETRSTTRNFEESSETFGKCIVLYNSKYRKVANSFSGISAGFSEIPICRRFVAAITITEIPGNSKLPEISGDRRLHKNLDY